MLKIQGWSRHTLAGSVVLVCCIVGTCMAFQAHERKLTTQTRAHVGNDQVGFVTRKDVTMFPDWGKVTLAVSAPDEVRLGASVNMNVILRNMSNWTALVHRGNETRQLDVRVFKDGKQCPRTDRGEQVLKPTSVTYTPGGPAVQVGPGESLNWKLNLAECYLLHPGTYTVTASVSVGAWDGANAVEFGEAIQNGAPLDGREVVSNTSSIVVK